MRSYFSFILGNFGRVLPPEAVGGSFLSFFGTGHLSLFADESWVSTVAWRPLAPLPFIRAFMALLFAEVSFEAHSVACSEVLDVSRHAGSAVAGLLVGACWGQDYPRESHI